jgi:hypothetical protein
MKYMAWAVLAVSLVALNGPGCDTNGGDQDNTGQQDVTGQQGDGKCVVACGGKSCGDDGCGGSCGNCFSLEGAVDNQLCVEGECVACLPDCDGKQCGDDGCGGSCGNCFTIEGAIDNGLCLEGTCVQCVTACDGKECGDDGCGGTCGICTGDEVCGGGKCGIDDGLCALGELCLSLNDDGDLACLLNDELPPDNETQCHDKDGGCAGNYSCQYLDDEKTKSLCVENCGVCPSGLTCGDVTGDGYMGCMQAGSIPQSAKYNCHEDGCPDNNTCFYLNAEYTESACIQNCSTCHPGSCPEGEVCNGSFCEPEPCTEGSCPEGQNCVSGTCVPDAGPGPGSYPGGLEDCPMPPLECEGNSAYCGALIHFDPTEGYGYIDYPENGETWDNQYRSWLRRDVVMAIQYAAAKVECLAKDWEFGNGKPIGLIDMSEEDGSIPGTSVGQPGHPQGTHVDGFDIDVSYFQHGTSDNAARPICDHYENGAEAYHCTAPPHLLDPWRQALFIGALHEHPALRVIGCDGQAGPIIDATIDKLCDEGWLKPAACGSNKLTYETTDMGYGWFHFHHHHIHISFNSTKYRDKCLIPGCLDGHLKHFLARHGLAKVQKTAMTRVSVVR